MTHDGQRFSQEVSRQEKRKLRAHQEAIKSIWFGLGMFGLIGWSVALPTFLGALLGVELDRRYPGPHSWTLTLLVVGLAIGSLNAWHWVAQQGREMEHRDDAT